MPAPRKKADRQSGEGPIPQHEHCWAKTTEANQPGINVRDHCLNVGCVAEALLALLPKQLRKLLPPAAATLAAMHDLGKVSPGFQQKCQAWVDANRAWFKPGDGYESRHPRVSQVFLEAAGDGRLRGWAEAVGAHHGRVQGDDPAGDLGGERWDRARRELLEALEGEFRRLPKKDAPSEAAKWLMAGLIAVADWLGSDEKEFSPEDPAPLDKKKQRTKADDIVKRLELAGAKLVGEETFEHVFAERLNGSPPRSLQRTIITENSLRPGVYVIEDTMGSGKTEAALWLAYRLISAGHARGLYFGLPTRVTSDRIHRRVREFLNGVYKGGIEPRLVHGHAWLRDMPLVHRSWRDPQDNEEAAAAAQAAQQWFGSSRCGLLAPFAVGTVDQPLLGVVAAKWFFVRQFALAGKVVVLDEVHSYDLYTGTLIAELVKRLRELRATPVILSATLTANQRAALLDEPVTPGPQNVDYPSITVKSGEAHSHPLHVQRSSDVKQVHISQVIVLGFNKGDIHPVVEHAIRMAEQGHNIVWIRNTVRHAQEAYRALNGEKRGDAFEVGLLHSRYPAFQRGSYPKLSLEELKKHHLHEERWLWMLGKPEAPRPDARPRGCVLVATQVVEQSVDIDADVLITDLAPTDMLLQRLGRLHRHARGDRGQPTAHLVVPEAIANRSETMSTPEIKAAFGGVGRVYMPYVLLRTWEQWRQRSQIVLPTELRPVLEDTYSDRAQETESWQELLQELNVERDRLRHLALRAADVRGRELKPDEEGLLTRVSSQKQILLLLLRWVSDRVDRLGNPEEFQLLNGEKLKRESIRKFNLYAARQLHLNTATIPAWWLLKSSREPPPPVLAQYFTEEVGMAVYDGRHEQLRLALKPNVGAPVISYHPLEGLWLEKPPDKKAQRLDEDGEYEDGMF
jgi:CRISPR-associated endonuclease/helicase Cas3